MPSFRDTFDERRNRALEAKKAMVAAFASRPGPDDPKVREREAARKAVAEARDARAAEREKLRQEALERARVEAATREAERLAAEAEAARLRAEAEVEAERLRVEAEAERKKESLRAATRVIADEAERKAARDARYAARKARQG